MFKLAGRRPPTRDDRVRIVLAGIRRAHAGPTKQAAPLTGDLLRQVTADLDPERVADVRDGALLLVASPRRCGGPSWSLSTWTTWSSWPAACA